MISGRWLLVAVAATMIQNVLGVQAAGSASELTFRPFDKTSIPLANGLPADVQGYDRKLFALLGQDENNLVYCPWKNDELAVARQKVKQGFTSDIYGPAGGYQYVTPGGISDKINAHLMQWYFGKLDTADLWLSKYWAKGALSAISKAWPHVFRGSGRAIFDIKTEATPVSHEGLSGFFRSPDGVFVDDRLNPGDDGATQGILFTVNTSFVKFKEVYAAGRSYCMQHGRSGQLLVAGWARDCIASTVRDRDMETSHMAQASDTIIHVGMICN